MKSLFFSVLISCLFFITISNVWASEDIKIKKEIQAAKAILYPIETDPNGPYKGEYNRAGWEKPDVENSTLFEIVTKDATQSIAGKETKVEIFTAKDGTTFNRLSINGNVFEYLVDTDGKEPFEYAIIDMHGDGVFDFKKPAETRMYIPSWVNRPKMDLKMILE